MRETLDRGSARGGVVDAGAVIRPRALRSARARLLVVASLAVLALAGCSLVGGPGPSQPSSGSGPSSSRPSSSSAAAAARLVVDDGFTTLSTLPKPIASVGYQELADGGAGEMQHYRADLVQLRRSGDVVRAVVAALDPSQGEGSIYFPMERGDGDASTRFEVDWKVYDPAAATEALPLRTAQGDGGCLCTMSAHAVRGGSVNLLWADFPAPTSKRFTLLLGSAYPPMEGLTVPAETSVLPPEGDLLAYPWNSPPPVPGRGAMAPVVQRVVSRSETASGITATSSGEQQQLALPSDVLFAVDSDIVEAGAGEGLDQAAAAVAAVAKDTSVTITGHTDDQAGQAYNQDLSQRRARAVADPVGPVLEAAGIDVDVAGKGEDEPLVPNTTDGGDPIPQNQARNRRVAFSWTGAAAIAPAAGTSTVAPALPLAVPAPGPAPKGSIADALSTSTYGPLDELTGGMPAARLDVRSARREGGQVRVDLTVTALDPEVAWGSGESRLVTSNRGGSESLLATSVLDPSTGITSFALADEGGTCLCTRNLDTGQMELGETRSLWVFYPAPPEGVRSVDLQMGSFGRLQGVPIS